VTPSRRKSTYRRGNIVGVPLLLPCEVFLAAAVHRLLLLTILDSFPHRNDVDDVALLFERNPSRWMRSSAKWTMNDYSSRTTSCELPGAMVYLSMTNDSVLSPSVAHRRKWTKCWTSEMHRTPHFCLLIASVCACAPGKENEGWNLGRGNTLARWDFPYFPFDVIDSGGRDFFVGLRILLIYVVSTLYRVGSMFVSRVRIG